MQEFTRFPCFWDSEATAVSSLLLIGGGSTVEEDMARFNEHGGNIIVATPGRLLDIIGKLDQRTFDVKDLEALVMDEADMYSLICSRPLYSFYYCWG